MDRFGNEERMSSLQAGKAFHTAESVGWRSTWAAVLLSALAWTAIGVVFALPRFGASRDWLIVLRTSLADWWAWGLLAPAIIAIDLRLPIAVQHLGRRFLAHIGIGLIASLVYSYVSALLEAVMGTTKWSEVFSAAPLQEAIKGGLLWDLLVYLLVVGGWQAVQSARRQAVSQWHVERLERRFSEARLNALRMQLDPHFLFNALNTISALVESEPLHARSMIEQLGDLLRLSLQGSGRQQVRLAEELEFLSHYLAIQKTRFGEDLIVTIDVPAWTRDVLVPSLILQPLVENAVRHGLSPRPGGGNVWISAAVVGGMLQLTIDDDGVGLGAHWQDENTGLGIGVARERIAMLHPGKDFGLFIGPRAEGGTHVSLRIPMMPSREPAHD